MDRIQAKLVPIASMFGNNLFLLALKNALLGSTPIVLTGSFAMLLTLVFVDFPNQLGIHQIATAFQWLETIDDLICSVSLSVVSLFLAYNIGNQIAKIYNVDAAITGLVSLASFLLSINFPFFKGDSEFLVKEVGKLFSSFSFGVNGYFTAIIVGGISSILFCKWMKKKWKLPLPDGVPPAVGDAVMTVVPALLTLYSIALLVQGVYYVTHHPLADIIYHFVQAPLLSLSQHIVFILLIIFLNKLFWFFGLHGGNILSPVMEGIFGLALLSNLQAVASGQSIPYIWNSGTFAAFIWIDSLALALAMLLVSKDSHQKSVARMGVKPAFFNIGETIQYGLPVMLNQSLLLPYFCGPMLIAILVYTALRLEWVAPITQNMIWVTPPVISGFLGTSFDIRSILLTIICLAIEIICYLPFLYKLSKK